MLKYWWHRKLCYVPDGPPSLIQCTGYPQYMYHASEFDNLCDMVSYLPMVIRSNISQHFWKRRKLQFPEIGVRFPFTMTLLRVLQLRSAYFKEAHCLTICYWYISPFSRLCPPIQKVPQNSIFFNACFQCTFSRKKVFKELGLFWLLVSLIEDKSLLKKGGKKRDLISIDISSTNDSCIF